MARARVREPPEGRRSPTLLPDASRTSRRRMMIRQRAASAGRSAAGVGGVADFAKQVLCRPRRRHAAAAALRCARSAMSR